VFFQTNRLSRSDRCSTEIRTHLREPHLCLLTLKEPLTSKRDAKVSLITFIPVTLFRYFLVFYICLSYELSLQPPPPPHGFLLVLFFFPEYRRNMLLRNVGFSGNYRALQTERLKSIISQGSNFQSPQWKPQIPHACVLNVSWGLMSIGKLESP
jgi:hypothetical protein